MEINSNSRIFALNITAGQCIDTGKCKRTIPLSRSQHLQQGHSPFLLGDIVLNQTAFEDVDDKFSERYYRMLQVKCIRHSSSYDIH